MCYFTAKNGRHIIACGRRALFLTQDFSRVGFGRTKSFNTAAQARLGSCYIILRTSLSCIITPAPRPGPALAWKAWVASVRVQYKLRSRIAPPRRYMRDAMVLHEGFSRGGPPPVLTLPPRFLFAAPLKNSPPLSILLTSGTDPTPNQTPLNMSIGAQRTPVHSVRHDG